MPQARRVYGYQIPLPPNGMTTELMAALQERITASAGVNPQLKGGWVERTDEAVLLQLIIMGRDQWWIKKRAPYIAAAIMVATGIPVRVGRLIAVARDEDPRSTRKRASDGRHNVIDGDVMIEHEELQHG